MLYGFTEEYTKNILIINNDVGASGRLEHKTSTGQSNGIQSAGITLRVKQHLCLLFVNWHLQFPVSAKMMVLWRANEIVEGTKCWNNSRGQTASMEYMDR